MDDLSLVTSLEMIEELGKRYRHVVLITEKTMQKDEGETSFFYRGGITGAVGLCERMKASLCLPRPEDKHTTI